MRGPRVILILALVFTTVCCTKQSVKNNLASQEELIEDFLDELSSNDSTVVTVSAGCAMKCIVVAGSGDELASDGVISFYYAGYVLEDEDLDDCTLFTTNNYDTALEQDWDLSSEDALDILTVKLSEANFVQGLRDGLTGTQGGEECYVLFSSKYGHGDKALGTIPANSPQVWHIWVESISND